MDSSRKSRCVRNKTFTTTTVHGDLERYRKIDDEIELSPPLIPNSIESLLEGLSLPADPTNKTDFTVPPWLDMGKLKRGQRFAMQNFFSLCVSEMMSLLLIFTFKGSLSTLVMTNKSSSPFTAFQRYISTLVRLRSWYQDDLWESKSAAGRHITAVRLMHRSVRDRLRDQDSRHIAHQVDSPCCPLLDKIKNDIKAALAMPKSGQCPYNTMEGQVHVNQYYMAITQFAFVGLAVVYPRKFGIKINKKLDQELDAFVHLWAAIAYLLGTEDRFNICIGGLADCREKSAALIETWIKPNLHDVSPDWEHMSRCLIEGTSYYVVEIDFEAFLYYVCWVLGIPMPLCKASLSWRSRFFFALYWLVLCVFMHFVPTHRAYQNWLLNFRMNKSIKASKRRMENLLKTSDKYLRKHSTQPLQKVQIVTHEKLPNE